MLLSRILAGVEMVGLTESTSWSSPAHLDSIFLSRSESQTFHIPRGLWLLRGESNFTPAPLFIFICWEDEAHFSLFLKTFSPICHTILPDLAGSKVQFDSRGDGLARYMILNYQRSRDTGIYKYEVSYTIHFWRIFFQQWTKNKSYSDMVMRRSIFGIVNEYMQ
jgi:hypothetical protein